MYRAPVSEMAHIMRHVAGVGDALAADMYPSLSDDLLEAILEEAGKVAADVVAPMHLPSDRHGTPYKDGAVTTMPGWKDAYQLWAESGWNALTGDEAYGGQGLPQSLGMAAMEMWNSGSMAFGLTAMLTTGAIEALQAHASDALKAIYLENMISGRWTGTMNLTEPQAGSDLAAIKSRAEPRGDGTYRIFGQKIFITWGEHDMTDNIVHLVLARLPDAPAGTRGISLFLVPKFLPDENGAPSARNDVFCAGLEHKLGIHHSPTCTMIFGDGKFGDEAGAIGWLVGEENRGLNCMFTMMNNARLAVGIQGVAVAEAATQKAIAFANERRQGKASGFAGDGMAPIVHHPDIQRNLLTMSALTKASRAICYACAHAIDMAHMAQGEEAKSWSEKAGLLTPIAKSFSTDIGSMVASIGVQVHGGMGFVEETGAAIYMRDARIAQIYEGTNGIQAIDLVGRKLPLSGGAAVNAYLEELRAIVAEVANAKDEAFGSTAARLADALADLTAGTQWIVEQQKKNDMDAVLAAATPYQHMFGLVAGGCYLAKSALADKDGKRTPIARFYAENLLAESSALLDRVEHGGESLAIAASELMV